MTPYHGTELILAPEAFDAKQLVEEIATLSEKGRVIGTAGAALGLGAFAAAVGACCALPWAVALLGVSGAVALARLTFWWSDSPPCH